MTRDSNLRRIKVSVLIVQDGKSSVVKRPYDEERMRSFQQNFGICGYLDELVEAPDVICEVLRAHGGIHTVLIGSQLTEDIINRGTDIFSVLASQGRKVALLTPSKKYVVSVSKYGKGNITCRTNDLLTPRLLAASSANMDEKKQLNATLTCLKNDVKGEISKIDELKKGEQKFLDARSDQSRRIMDIRSQLKSILHLDERIVETELKMECIQKDMSCQTSKGEENVLDNYNQLRAEQGAHAALCLKSLQSLFSIRVEQLLIDLRIQAQNVRLEMMKQSLAEAERSIRDIRDSYAQIKSDLLSAAKNAVQLKRIAEKQAPWKTNAEEFQQFSDDLEDLRARIENNKASLQCFRGDLHVRELYQRTCEEIEAEQKKLEDLKQAIDIHQTEMDQLKKSWHERLRSVIAQIHQDFQESFKDIGCIGEIVLDDKDHDIKKWGVERRAQFREHSKLAIISAEEQSGGEKSVSTIMYLMALQSLTQCPFRVVDEINQGMDIQNERKVFQRITSRSCGQRLPQYFLITPKLITGLNYHRDTKVIFILNGSLNKLSQARMLSYR